MFELLIINNKRKEKKRKGKINVYNTFMINYFLYVF